MSNYLVETTNEHLKDKYLNRFNGSASTRKSALKYFFGKNQSKTCFGFNKHISKIAKGDLMDYFDFLNNLDTISIETKKLKWTILKSFIEYLMEYYDDFMVIIPKKTVSWNKIHKESNSNKNVVMTKEEVKTIIDYLKLNHYKYYLIFRILAETGMRKGGLINADYDNVNIKKRFIKTKEKSGRVVYYISKELAKELDIYLVERKSKTYYQKDGKLLKALFVSNRGRRFNPRAFNLFLKGFLNKIGIKKNITCHSFRRTINTLRKQMECPNEDRKILLNHKTLDVNINSYVKLRYNDFIKLYDRWNPYSELTF